jgi:hypothetical protein
MQAIEFSEQNKESEKSPEFGLFLYFFLTFPLGYGVFYPYTQGNIF